MTKNDIVKKLHRAIKTDRDPVVRAILDAWPDLVAEPHPTTRLSAIDIGKISKRPNSIRSVVAEAEKTRYEGIRQNESDQIENSRALSL